jgi:hypothetical protein
MVQENVVSQEFGIPGGTGEDAIAPEYDLFHVPFFLKGPLE